MKIKEDVCRYFYGRCHVVTGENGEILAIFKHPEDAEKFASTKKTYRKIKETKI